MRKKGQRKVGKKPFKRMRKSSFNKIQKKFDVFHEEIDHFNNYESLTLDISDPEIVSVSDNESSDDEPIYKVDVDKTNHKSIPEVVDHRENKINKNGDGIKEDHLGLNNDFIPFSESDSEEYENNENDNNELEILSVSHKQISIKHETYSRRTTNEEFPWLLNHDHSRQRDISKWITLEMKDFISYISPSREEIEIRNKTIQKLRKVVRRLWPDSTLHVFGSYATDLYLPGSDIDCVITSKTGNKEHRSYLYELARYLKSNGIGKQIEVIAKARVPIIKFVDVDSDLHIDVSFERLNGIEIAKIIRTWLHETPGLRELVLVIKQFLKSRRLNEVHTGGLGGLSIVCLVYSFLHLHPRLRTEDIDARENLGVLLMDFFELYGKNFSYEKVALSFQDDIPTYIPKSHWRALPPSRSSLTLAIQDPLDVSNNISRSSYNVSGIKKAFSGAFNIISNKCYELNQATFKDRVGKSILGNIIKYKGDARHFKDERELVENRAIVENEVYHMKRSRSVLDLEKNEDMFLNPSDDELLTGGQDELSIYRVSEPAKKKQRRNVTEIADIPKKKKKKIKKKPENITKLIPKGAPSKKIDELMGIEDDDDINDNDTIMIKENDDSANPPRESTLQSTRVDAQTRRDYWLSKGQTLASVSISKKNT
ncbi:similar to Saccharomyces cerevisiae YOL115W PAP2 Non-canonical poly(A) polymerase, involved in nuclear RNA degradation as a component of the TRAMP complex [Maudiozyma saulgeensis]|uniref:polynucleotide adenylyltransferase n=1 Tax=Maudiozyma saulgeensis TaxID=1789683 RepID=A0A1X7R1F5_9SACH|nr:similar to Saccharomyces cerevisiae YOL115W PAP2 Non-canonical poly(A) polymerase, involved in nuclear RNA degradation as a component of the TRAMP complex [Kazachstania saulgeensis]